MNPRAKTKQMSANQLVAHNLRRAREEAGLTQEQAAQRLERYLGERWSKASFSVAERSVDEGSRKRQFDANELLAFSRAFGRPIAWFFTPPDKPEGIQFLCGTDVSRVVGRGELVESVTPTNLMFKVEARELRRAAESATRIADSLDPPTKKKGGNDG